LLARFAKKPVVTLEVMHGGKLQERGVHVGLTTLRRFLKR
jgi:hypothetical protein